ncbi:MAG: 3-isopropylmalate dehydratase small subunit [Truepera sp.]|nr:3-isopropylmalate dehydratase small subunit [Truepera sp.]
MNALKPIKTVTGRAVFLPGNDIDTDRIIPARFLKCVTFDGLGEHLFRDERFTEEGTPKRHPLNEPRYLGATILLSGSNFGCGSSREHAPQALYRHGIRAIVTISVAEIFFGNSTTLGLPCVQANAGEIHRLARLVESDPTLKLTLDLEALTVSFGDDSISVELPEDARKALVTGRWDPIADLLEGTAETEVTAANLPYLSG